MATYLPSLPDVQRLSPRVIRILGGNPSKFTLQGTNTYLVGTGPSRLLVDTGEGLESWASRLKSVLTSESATVSHAVLTHWHPDHVGGTAQLHKLCPGVIIYKQNPSPGQEPIQDEQMFRTEGAHLRAFHCPGHATDHMSFILPQEDAMFTGDNVLGHGTAVFEDLASYLNSLESMREQFVGRAYPGHGAVIEDGKAKINEYIEHRKEREREILRALGELGKESEPAEIVKIVYKDYPTNLHAPAASGVVQILQKFEGQGLVKSSGHGRWQIIGTPVRSETQDD